MNDAVWNPAPGEDASERIEANMRGLWEFAGRGPGCTCDDDGRLTCVSSGPFAWPNLCFHPRLSGVPLDPYLAGLCDRIRVGRCPRAWVRGHEEGPSGLYERLQAFGFREVARRPTMRFDLASPRLERELPPVGGLEVRHLVSAAGLEEWLGIVAGAFFGGRVLGRALFAEHLLPSPLIRLYLARLNGQAVGTALLSLHAGVAGLHLVGVPESHRRRGIAMRVTLHVLREARALGYRVATLKASPLGEGIYVALGFQHVSRLIIYNWTDDRPTG